jgi:hemoglobin
MKLIIFIFIFFTFTALAERRPASGPSLFVRLGGKKGLTNVVSDFYDHVMKDIRIRGFFARTSKSSFKDNLYNQLCVVAGGPCHYKGRTMKHVHEGMGVSKSDFDAFLGILNRTLVKQKIPADARNELLHDLSLMQKDIVEAP